MSSSSSSLGSSLIWALRSAALAAGDEGAGSLIGMSDGTGSSMGMMKSSSISGAGGDGSRSSTTFFFFVIGSGDGDWTLTLRGGGDLLRFAERETGAGIL